MKDRTSAIVERGKGERAKVAERKQSGTEEDNAVETRRGRGGFLEMWERWKNLLGVRILARYLSGRRGLPHAS